MKYLGQISPSTLLSFLLGALLFGSHFVIGFTEPSSTPPLDNTPAPLNVSSTGQSKAGGLILNTGGATYGLIVDKGSVGIGISSPSQKLDVAGYIRAATGICIGGDCRTSWPSSASYSAGSGISISGATISNTGVLSETDPTVTPSVKDGVSWSEVSGKPFTNLCYCIQTLFGQYCASLGSWAGTGQGNAYSIMLYSC